MKAFTVKSHLTGIETGWGNGYVLIPSGHKLFGKHYDDIEIDIHGGLTFSEMIDEEYVKLFGLSPDEIGMWCIGFDTAHYGDSTSNWPQSAVENEAQNLLQQVLSFANWCFDDCATV